jgi:hypothetical protein
MVWAIGISPHDHHKLFDLRIPACCTIRRWSNLNIFARWRIRIREAKHG